MKFGKRGESKEEKEEAPGGEEVVRGCPLNFISKSILIPTVPACPPISDGFRFSSSTKNQNYTLTLCRHPPLMPISSFCASNEHLIGLKSVDQIAME